MMTARKKKYPSTTLDIPLHVPRQDIDGSSFFFLSSFLAIFLKTLSEDWCFNLYCDKVFGSVFFSSPTGETVDEGIFAAEEGQV